jgi:hypothetical protein
VDKFDYSLIPEHTRAALRRWVFCGIPPGGFLTAMLTNDLMGAIGSADSENIRAIPQIAMFIYNRLPALAQGSRERMEQWPERIADARSGVSGSFCVTFGPFDENAEPEHHVFEQD